MESNNGNQTNSNDSSVPTPSNSTGETKSTAPQASFADKIPLFVEPIKGMTDIFPISVSVTKDALDAAIKDHRVQAYKWGGDEQAAAKLLAAENWSAARDDFRLANAVLRNDFGAAVGVMVKMGNKGDVSRSDYKEWPRFRVFRQSQEFQRTFESIFGEPFNLVDKPNETVESQADLVH